MYGLSALGGEEQQPDPNATYQYDPEVGEYVQVGMVSGSLSGLMKTNAATDSSDPNYWSQRNADILRSQWDNWKQQYQPLEEYFAGLVTDPAQRNALRAESMGYVANAADNSYQRGMQSLADRDQRLGVGLDALEQASRDRKMQAGAAAVKAKGLTDMAGYLDEREQQMMSGGVAYAGAS